VGELATCASRAVGARHTVSGCPTAGRGNRHADVTYLPASQFAENGNLRAVYRLLAEKIGMGESWLLDLSRAFDDAGPIFFDWAHASPKANQIIARHMSEALTRLLHDSKPVRLATHRPETCSIQQIASFSAEGVTGPAACPAHCAGKPDTTYAAQLTADRSRREKDSHLSSS
jgi:hypothetical protein